MNDGTVSGCAFAFVVVALVVLVILGVEQENSWEAWCHGKGGTVHSITSTGIGTSASGQPVTTTSTTNLCLSSDGRILGTN